MQKDNFSSLQPPSLKDTTSKSDSLNTKVLNDTTNQKKTDSLSLKREKKQGIETSVKYTSEDSIVFDAEKQTMKLYRESKIDYGTMSLKSEEIKINWLTNNVEAYGVPDSTGKVRGLPMFKDKQDEYRTSRMVYNFKTKKGIISEVITKQGDGYVHGENVKKNPNNELYVTHSKYTTCNLAHPHFHIASSRIKMIPEKKVISGPFNIVFNDIPSPFGFLFGYFPIPKHRSSGFIVPEPGESVNQGFYLRNGGFYWAVNDYVGAKFLADLFSLGGAGAQQITDYRKKYAFEGNFTFRYNWVKFSRAATELNQNLNPSYHTFWVNWRHSTLSKKLGRLTADVNAGTSNFNQVNINNGNSTAVLAAAFQSSVQYSQSIRNSPFNYSVTLRQDQNVNGIKNFTLPDFNFAMNRLTPLQNISGGRKTEALRKLNFSYNFNLQNRLSNDPNLVGRKLIRVDTLDSAGVRRAVPIYGIYNFTDDANYLFNFDRLNNGIRHSIPISTSIKMLKYFSLNPSFTIDQFLYNKSLKWGKDTVGGREVLKSDTIYGISGPYQYTFSTNLTTRVYGIFYLRTGRLEALRHTFIPTLNYSFRPDFSDSNYGFYDVVNINGRDQKFNKHQGFVMGAPSIGSQSAVTFSMNNNFELKVREKNDSVDTKKKFKKVTLLDNLGASGGYNFLADSMKLSNIAITARTRLLGMFDIAFSTTLDPYDRTNFYDSTRGNWVSRRINKLQYDEGRGLASIISSNLAFGFGLNSDKFKKTKKPDLNDRINAANPTGTDEQLARDIRNNPNRYLDFTIPWAFNVAYNLNYSQLHIPYSQPDIYTHSITYNGNVSMTTKWKVTFNSGYNLTQKRVTYTTIGITRDLHCWVMSVNWVPPIPGAINTGSYNFQINVKSPMLQDLKLTRNRFWIDQ